MKTRILTIIFIAFSAFIHCQENKTKDLLMQRIIETFEKKINKPIPFFKNGEAKLKETLSQYLKDMEKIEDKTPNQIYRYIIIHLALGKKEKAIELLYKEKINKLPLNKLLKLGILFSEIWNKDAVKRIVSEIKLQPNATDRENVIYQSLIAFSNYGSIDFGNGPKNQEKKYNIIRKLKDIEVQLKALPLPLERALLRELYKILKNKDIKTIEAEKRIAMIKGLSLEKGKDFLIGNSLLEGIKKRKAFIFLGLTNPASKDLLNLLIKATNIFKDYKLILFVMNKLETSTKEKLKKKEIIYFESPNGWESWFVKDFGITRIPMVFLVNENNKIENILSGPLNLGIEREVK